MKAIRQKINIALEFKKRDSWVCRWCDRFLVTLILLNVVAMTLQTLPAIAASYANIFAIFEAFSITIFTVEYLLRVWSCTEHYSGKYAHPIGGRLRFLISPLLVIDLITLMPYFLGMTAIFDGRYLRIFRLLRIIKITRYFQALETLSLVLKRERLTLIAIITLLLSLLLFASSSIYFLERDIQPQAFASIPHAMWWGMTTLTTVGYGDVVPLSVPGKILGVIIMITGIGMFALPTGILASAFAEEAKRKCFIVTWNLVARVPFFNQLNASSIATIADLLRPQIVMPNDIIVHRDQIGDCMYFIVSGEVEVELAGHPMRLKQGDFFGEIALLFSCTRTATVMAVTYVELLQLDIQDLQTMFKNDPCLKQHMEEEAKQRLNIVQQMDQESEKRQF